MSHGSRTGGPIFNPRRRALNRSALALEAAEESLRRALRLDSQGDDPYRLEDVLLHVQAARRALEGS